jgi:cobyrinic acid a,c-diamide synthase
VGPDFIDPGHHTRITHRVSRNLDGWMLSKDYNLRSFLKHTQSCDIAVVEGVMGLFDGYEGRSEAGSTAQMAKWLGLPVLLVVNAKSMARSAAALVQGFERFDEDLPFAGVLFNNLGSDRHLSYLKEALTENVSMPCLGGMVHDQQIEIPERHLGLVTREDHALSKDQIQKLAHMLEQAIDIDRLIDTLPEIDMPAQGSIASKKPETKDVRIGVAMDNAFCFYYRDNLDFLESTGAELVYFSPVNENRLPENLHGLYFGGGYPELFAPQLAENRTLRYQIRENCLNGMPIYGECGGFMYLGKEIRDLDQKVYPMTGCFPITFTMLSRLKSLGYREITFEQNTILGKKGQKMRGHEFHYSEIDAIHEKTAAVYSVTPRSGTAKTREGYQTGRCLGSYIHLHFGSRPEAAQYFIRTCRKYKTEKG